MARRRASAFFSLFLLSTFLVSSCVLFSEKYGKYKKLESEESRIFHFPRRELVEFFFPKETIHEKIEPPVIYPAPPNIPAPPVVNTPPPSNPLITVTPNPTITPGTNPSATPVPVPNTNPASSLPPPSPIPVPVPNTNPTTPFPPPSAVPVPVPNTNPTSSFPPPSAIPVPVPNTNPTSSFPPPSAIPVTQPVMPPPAGISTTPSPGRGWCVAKSGAPQAAIQAALDYACGVGGVDCSVVQQGGSCYNPVTLENHASYAFNSYYQRNPVPTSCDFGGTAMITTNNPSSGSCIFPTSSSTPASSVPPPVTQTPTQTPPTPSAIPTPPAILAPPAAPTPPASSTPPTVSAPPALPTPLAAPTPPAFPTPPASTTPPSSPTPPASLRPPASPAPPTAVPRASGPPVSANSTKNTTSGFPMGGFPNIFPIVNTSMPPDNPPSVTSMSKPRTLPQPFVRGIILLTITVTWNHILDL